MEQDELKTYKLVYLGRGLKADRKSPKQRSNICGEKNSILW